MTHWYMTWLIDSMWHDSCMYGGTHTICVPWLICICDTTHLHVTWLTHAWRDSPVRDMTHRFYLTPLMHVWWYSYDLCAVTHLYISHDSLICDMSHIPLSHVSYMCVCVCVCVRVCGFIRCAWRVFSSPPLPCFCMILFLFVLFPMYMESAGCCVRPFGYGPRARGYVCSWRFHAELCADAGLFPYFVVFIPCSLVSFMCLGVSFQTLSIFIGLCYGYHFKKWDPQERLCATCCVCTPWEGLQLFVDTKGDWNRHEQLWNRHEQLWNRHEQL